MGFIGNAIGTFLGVLTAMLVYAKLMLEKDISWAVALMPLWAIPVVIVVLCVIAVIVNYLSQGKKS